LCLRKYLKIILPLIIIVLGGYLFFYGNPLNIQGIEDDVQNYLIRGKSYKREEIQEVKGNYDWLKCSCYYASVRFKDEPDATYYYGKNLGGEIIQQGYSSSRQKPLHEEK
jgi:hypothetical protein